MGLKHLQVPVWAVTFAAAAGADPQPGGTEGPLDKPGWWYESFDCSGEATHLLYLGDIPANAKSYIYEDDQDQCYWVTVMTVQGRPRTAPPGIGGNSSYSYYESWNTGLGVSSGLLGSTLYVVRGDDPNDLADDDYDGDGVGDSDDLCADEYGEEGFHGCKAKTYCMEVNETYDQACFGWAARNLSHAELGNYYEGLRDFAEGGCGDDQNHWACYGVYEVQQINWADVWQTLRDYVADTYGRGVTRPECPLGYTPQLMYDHSGYGLSFYSGSCINICRQALFHAGLLTSVGVGAGAVAASTAGRVALSNALTGASMTGGAALSVDQLIAFCDGPTWVEPLD